MSYDTFQYDTTLYDTSGDTTIVVTLVCPCSTFTWQGTGGVSCFGTAGVSDTITGGIGLTYGGKAAIDIPELVFDGLAEMWLLNEQDSPYRELVFGDDGTSDPATAPAASTGVYCRGCQYFGSKQFITIPLDLIRPDQSFSVSLWASIETNYISRTWWSKTGVASLGYTFLNQIFVIITLADGTPVYCQGGSIMDRNHMHLVSFSYDPTSAVTLFLNGVADGATPLTGSNMATGTAGGYIGRLGTASLPTGDLQQVTVYPEAMPASFWLANYQNLCLPSFITAGAEVFV